MNPNSDWYRPLPKCSECGASYISEGPCPQCQKDKAMATELFDAVIRDASSVISSAFEDVPELAIAMNQAYAEGRPFYTHNWPADRIDRALGVLFSAYSRAGSTRKFDRQLVDVLYDDSFEGEFGKEFQQGVLRGFDEGPLWLFAGEDGAAGWQVGATLAAVIRRGPRQEAS